MVESRWVRRIGPGIATSVAIVVVAATTLGADTGSWSPPPCAGPPGAPALEDRDGRSAWFLHDPVLVDGSRRGTALTVGVDGAPTRVIGLDSEAFAAGPFGETILFGSDDGRTSRLAILDAASGCTWSIASSSDVIRRATLAPDGRTIFEMRVARSTRADRGIWRRSIDGVAPPVRVLAPLPTDDRFGRTFATEFTWSVDGRRLAVRSCGERSCRIRVLDPGTGRQRLLADPSLGDIVGLTSDRVVIRAACPGLPCPVLSVPVDGGDPVLLEEVAGIATLSALPDGTDVVVMEVGDGERSLRARSVDGASSIDLGPLPDGDRLAPLEGGMNGSHDLPTGWVAIVRDASDGLDPTPRIDARHIPDGRTVALDEVPR